MKVNLVTICYNEERFITPFLKHIPDWVDKKITLVSSKPWFGATQPPDRTAEIAGKYGVSVRSYWQSEEDQRNTGQALSQDADWVIILDPDEYLDNENWSKLKNALRNATADALVVRKQRVFWKDKEVAPCNDYQQLIAVRPQVRFVDKRVVNTRFDVSDVELLHFSWARTDEEVWNKISHYAHAHDFDIEDWYVNVWKADKQTNMHPTSPEALGGLIEAKLPPEIEKLKLFP